MRLHHLIHYWFIIVISLALGLIQVIIGATFTLQVNESGKGSQCNHAIMLITDGAPETYEQLFEAYNWPDKQVSTGTLNIYHVFIMELQPM